MSWHFDETRPIFQQIVEQVTIDILSGKYQPGGKLPSVRDYALEAGVNPNTMQKALSALEESGLIVTQRNSGRTITEDTALIFKLRRNTARDAAKKYLDCITSAGLSVEDAIEMIKEVGKL